MNIALEFENYADAAMQNYISETVANICTAIAPIAVAGTTIYILMMGYAIASGQVQTPVVTAIRRILMIAFIGGIALSAGAYQTIVVDFFLGLRDGLVEALNPAYTSPGQAIDEMGKPFLDLSQKYSEEASANSSMIYFDIALWLAAGIALVAWFVFFSVSLGLYIVATVGLGLTLGVGPIFILLALWPATNSYTERWVAQVASFAVLSMLIVAVILIFGEMLKQYAEQTSLNPDDSKLVAAGTLLFMSLGALMVLLNLERLANALVGGPSLGSALGVAMAGARALGNAAGSANRRTTDRERAREKRDPSTWTGAIKNRLGAGISSMRERGGGNRIEKN